MTSISLYPYRRKNGRGTLVYHFLLPEQSIYSKVIPQKLYDRTTGCFRCQIVCYERPDELSDYVVISMMYSMGEEVVEQAMQR